MTGNYKGYRLMYYANRYLSKANFWEISDQQVTFQNNYF